MGEVLSTRVYRGVAPPGAGAGVEVVSVCCTTHVLAVAAYEVASCWAEVRAGVCAWGVGGALWGGLQASAVAAWPGASPRAPVW